MNLIFVSTDFELLVELVRGCLCDALSHKNYSVFIESCWNECIQNYCTPCLYRYAPRVKRAIKLDLLNDYENIIFNVTDNRSEYENFSDPFQDKLLSRLPVGLR